MRWLNIRWFMYLFLLVSFDSFSLAEDKTKHLAVSSVIGFSSSLAMENNLYSFGLCTSVGLAKEFYDQIDYRGFSGADLVFDAIGCGLGVLGGNMVNWRLGYKEYHRYDKIKMLTIEFDLPF